MSVVVDNTGLSAGGTSATTITISSFAQGAGTVRCIWLGVSQWKASDTVPTAAFNGSENFVFVDEVTIAEAPGVRRVTILRLDNPTVTTANIVVSWSTAVDEAVCGAVSFTASGAITFGTAVKNTGGTGTTSISVIVPNASGDLVLDTISADSDPSPAATGNQTQRWRAIATSNSTEGAGQSAAGTGSNITCTWSNLHPSFPGAVVAQIGIAIHDSGVTAVPLAPLVAAAMRPTPKGLSGRVAMAMRALRAPQATIANATFTDSVTEAGSVADTETATASFVVARAETLAASDTETAALVAPVALTETLSASDSETGTLSAVVAIAETLTASDAETGALVAAVTRTESLTATDTQDATVTAAGQSAQAESVSVTDSQTVTVVFAAVRTDTLSATDSELGTVTTAALIAEVLTLAATQDGVVPGQVINDWIVMGPVAVVDPLITLTDASPTAVLTDVSPTAVLTNVSPTIVVTPTEFP